ncbi:Zn-dependent protease [Aeromicrobium panaciterrae]|uniref:Zn-dependent protease n=1 Tax=Aeromicrobium panaciterrae TaxID=363861 RepID=A0ABU1UP67_9ACTN|nr:site-2 protease family protein [Aeromicrobium panaciterrae]MDR7086938.1 Zn-dependent protease [Aeromicrobium panaciterrae]
MSERPLPKPAGTWRLGRVGGVDLLVKPSIVLMGVVLVILFAPRFDDRSDSNPYALAAAFVLALYVSVFVHELAHVFAARQFGMRVQSVTLHLLGGETLIEGESRTPWQELWISISGPLTSLGIGLSARSLSGSFEGVTSDILWSVGYVNILVAIFNMLPGLPLDGGRVFRALVWQVTGREETGVRISAWIGRAAAIGIVVFALLNRGDSQLGVNIAIALIVAWFLWQGASDALRNASRSSRINMLVARSIVDTQQPPPEGAPTLSADLHGSALLRAMAAQPADVYALTDVDGTVIGSLTARAVDDAYRASR